MKKKLVLPLAVGLWLSAGVAEALDPTLFNVLQGNLEQSGPTDSCDRISVEVDALYATDGKCLKLALEEGDDAVLVEVVFHLPPGTAEPPSFWVRLVSHGGWQELVALENTVSGGFEEIPMSPTATDGSSVSGPLPPEYVDAKTGVIRMWILSASPGPVQDDQTLDEVEILIPPP